jgi:hypothetical protein
MGETPMGRDFFDTARARQGGETVSSFVANGGILLVRSVSRLLDHALSWRRIGGVICKLSPARENRE